jgi:hypothetical protein
MEMCVCTFLPIDWAANAFFESGAPIFGQADGGQSGEKFASNESRDLAK